MKTQKLLAVILFFILGVASFHSTAQIVLQDIADRITNCDNIFEGEIIRSNCYWNQDKTFIYTSLTVDITKIFKGNLQCGTVEIITEGGKVGDNSLIISHNLVLEKGEMGLFMCKQNDKELPLVDFYQETNASTLDPQYDEQSFIKYFDDDINKTIVDYQFSLDSLAQLYNLLEVYTQLNYTDCYPTRSIFDLHQERLHQKSSEARRQEELHNEEMERIYQDKLHRHLEDLENNRALTRVRGGVNITSITSLTFTLQNQQITTSGNTKYFEFDLALSDNADSIYFMSAVPVISYDTLIFGSKIDLNNNITVTRGTVLLDTSTYRDPYTTDYSPFNLVSITINEHFPNPSVNYYPLTTTPTNAVHVKMKIQNCNFQGNVDFVYSVFSNYGDDPVNPTVPVSTYSWLVGGGLVFSGCGSMGVGNIVPNSVRGGTGDVVTINGIGFDSLQGTGNVFLRNADNGGLTYMPLDSLDILSWSDTQIQFVVPSIVDSVGSVRTYAPGSGFVKVRNDGGVISDTLSNYLTIRFAAQNSMDSASRQKYLSNLINPFNKGTYLFRPDTNFSHHSDRLNCLSTAIRDWVCATGVNFTLGNDTTIVRDSISPPKQDTVNIVRFGTLSTGTLAKTYIFGILMTGGCNNNFTTENDIIVNKNYASQFFCSTNPTDTVPVNMYDLYQILLHELGHAHMLKHVNNPNNLMWWSADHNGILPSNRRIILYTDSSAMEGGHYIVSHSTSFDTANCVGQQLMTYDTTGNCTSWVGISQLHKPDVQFGLYPNPSNGSVNFDYTVGTPSEVEIAIYDYLGRTIYTQTMKKRMPGTYTERINAQSFADGFYLVNLTVNKFEYVQKLVKQ